MAAAQKTGRRGRRRGWALSLVVCGVIASTAAWSSIPLTGSGKAAFHKQIEACEQQWRTAVLASDIPVMTNLLDEGYVGIGPDGTIAGKTEELQARATGREHIERFDVLDRRIRIYGTTAVVTSRVRIQGVYSGEPTVGEYRYTRVWSLEHGQWRVVSFEANRVHDAIERSR